MSQEVKINVSIKVIIFNKDGKILILRRCKTTKLGPLFWDFPGGTLEFGEDPLKGISREIKEETGLNVQDLRVVDVSSGFNKLKEFWVTICYTATSKALNVKISHEHDIFKWVSLKGFQKFKALPSLKIFAKKVKFKKV